MRKRDGLTLLLVLCSGGSLPAQRHLEPPVDLLAALRAMAIQPRVEKGHDIRVVDTNGKPQTNGSVTVYFHDDVKDAVRPAFHRRLAESYRDSIMSYLATFATFGKRYATDDQGIARIPRSGLGMLVGLRGNRVCLDWVGTSRELVLHPIQQVHVLVEDHQGNPAGGVPLWIRDKSAHGVSGFPPEQTDAKGRATLRVILFDSGRSWRVEPRLPLTNTPGITFDPRTVDSRPDRPLRIRLPPCGPVRVYVTGEDGKPIRDLESVYAASHENRIGLLRQRWNAVLATTVKDEVATFPFVEVGFVGEVTAVVGGVGGGVERGPKKRFAGPRRPGEMRAVALENVTRKPVLSFRVFTPDSKPVAEARMSVIFSNAKEYEVLPVTTDKAGGVSVAVPDALEDSNAMLTIVRPGRAGNRQSQTAAQFDSVDMRKSRSLGDVNLDVEQDILAGRLVNPKGIPIPGVVVSLRRGYADERSKRPETDTRPTLIHESLTDADGRFVFREIGTPARPLALHVVDARGNEYPITDGTRLVTGQKNKTVVAKLTSTVHGSVRGLGEHGKLPVEVRLVPWLGWVPLPAGGEFAFRSCPAGEYRVELRRTGDTEPLCAIPKIQVQAGVACRDPRLQDLDLTKLLPVVPIRVLGPGGLPLESVSLRLRVGGKTETRLHYTGRDGVARIPQPKNSAEVLVWERRGRLCMLVLPLDDKGMTVTLQPAVRISVRVKNVPALHPTQNLWAHVQPSLPPLAAKPWWMRLEGLGPGGVFRSGRWFEDSELNIRMPVPGHHVLRIGSQEFPLDATGSGPSEQLVIELDAANIERLTAHAKKLAEAESRKNRPR